MQNELFEVEKWFQHPVTAQMLRDNEQQQAAALQQILNPSIQDLGGFVKHFMLIGHLRGLKRNRALADDAVLQLKEQIKEI